MTSPDEQIRGDNIRKYFAELSGQAKEDATHKFLKRYKRRVQELLNMIESEPEPEPDQAQTLQASVAESDPSIISDQPATPEAIPPEQELTDISPCDCSVVEQHLRLAFEWLKLNPLTAAVIGKRARSQCVDDDEADSRLPPSVVNFLTAVHLVVFTRAVEVDVFDNDEIGMWLMENMDLLDGRSKGTV